MAGNLIQITDAGLAALIGPDKTGTAKHDITAIGLGNAAFAFDPSLKTLPHELKRITTFGGDNVAPNTVHVVMQDDTQDQYQLYSFGLYLDNGVLFGVYVQDTPILEKSPQAMMLLASDAVFTRIDATQLQFGPATFLNPPATETRQGVIEIATQDEVNAGTDDVGAHTEEGGASLHAVHRRPLYWPDRDRVRRWRSGGACHRPAAERRQERRKPNADVWPVRGERERRRDPPGRDGPRGL